MISLTLLSALVASPFVARAAPTDQNIALARQYAPEIRFHRDEKFFGSSVEYFLAGPLKPTDASGNSITPSGSLSDNNLAAAFPDSGNGVYLSVDRASTLDNFLTGQNPSQTSDAKIYAFVAPKANDVVDLFYWLFTPYNLAKTVPLLGQVGNHVGDWEYLRVRTVNGTATQVEYHAHSDAGSGTIPWSDAPKIDNDQRPIGYTASGSHGFWSSAGTFTYVNAVIFKLQDVTSDDGVHWDTKDALVVANYPDTYTDDLSWINFKGGWGNKGDDSCWWHFIHPECELVDPPPGPLRDGTLGISFAKTKSSLVKNSMDAPSLHALATSIHSHSSIYTVYVPGTTAPTVAIRQTCTAESDGNASHFVQNLKQQADGSFAQDDEKKTSFVYGSTAYTASSSGRTTVSVAACPTGTAVTHYSLAACSSNNISECNFSTERTIRAYSSNPAVKGVQVATAVQLNDLDVWKL